MGTNSEKSSRKRRSSDSGSGGGGWEIVYSGFVLILLCFFIMLSSFASIEQGKVMRFVKSFVSSVSILTGGLKFDRGLRIMSPSADIVDKENDLADLLKEVKALVSSLKSDTPVELLSSDKGVTMRLPDKLLFDLGSSDISKDADPLLKKISAIISKTSYDVRIEGHTDNLPILTWKFASNWELSTSRAVNVLRYFIEKMGISPLRLSAVGFGEYQPISPNDSPENRAKNRRVEIVFVTENKSNKKDKVGM